MSHPRFEFYEFDIEGYNYQNPVSFKDFRKRKNTDSNNKRIKVKPPMSETLYKHLESSIDPIVSLEITNQNINYPDYMQSQNHLNLVEYLNVYRKIKTRTSMNRKFYSPNRRKKIIDSLKEATSKNIEYIYHVFGDLRSFSDTPQTINYFHEGAYIFKIIASPNEKMICFGDFHGSFHTFFRNIFRLYVLGVLDLSNGQYKINDGYRLIFLGDLVDRGDFGLDIMYIISQFIIQNNTKDHLKIIVNRGNHEEFQTYHHYGFVDEYKSKIGNYENLFKRFYAYLPSAIVLEQNGNRFWMCHGGIPYTNFRGKPSHYGNVFDINPLFQTYPIAFIENNVRDYDVPTQIRWNDFHLDNNTLINYKRGDTGYLIGTTYLDQFLQQNQIHFIIRGHNDNYFNSFIFCQNPTYVSYGNLPRNLMDSQIYPLSKVPVSTPLSQSFPQNFITIVEPNQKINEFLHKTPISTFTRTSFNLSNGAVAMIDPYEFQKNIVKNKLLIDRHMFYPVVTISTNTDKDRFLTRDSFMLIHQLSPQNQSNQNYKGLFTKTFIMNKINSTQPSNFKNVIHPNRRNPSTSSTSTSTLPITQITPSVNHLTYPLEIDCKNIDSKLTSFLITSHNNSNENIKSLQKKEKYAVLFYLKKRICIGIREGSRRIIKITKDEIQFYRNRTNQQVLSLPMNLYYALIQLTPFISYNIIQKISDDKVSLSYLLSTNYQQFKVKLYTILIKNIPSITSFFSLTEGFKKLYDDFIKLNKIIIRSVQNIENNHKLSYHIDEFISIYNFICFYLFYYENKTFMKNINFVSNRYNINIYKKENVFNLFMSYLPNFSKNKLSIVQSLLGIDNVYFNELLQFINSI